MDPRVMVAVGVGGIAVVVALAVGVLRQAGVRSYAMPVGRVVRAGADLAVLMQRKDRYLPSLQGVSESAMTYSYALWLIPERGDGDVREIGLERGVPSGARAATVGAHGWDGSVVWLVIRDAQGVDVASGGPAGPPPAWLVNAPISQLLPRDDRPLDPFRVASVAEAGGTWLFLATAEEAAKELVAGARVYGDASSPGTSRPRGVHRVTAQPGPIARVAEVQKVGGAELRNGAFVRSGPGGAVVRLSNPDGFLVVHEAGDPVHPSVHFSRVNADGSVGWTADTGLGSVTQVLPHATLPALVGLPPGSLTEPMLAVLDVRAGRVRTRSLRGPAN